MLRARSNTSSSVRIQGLRVNCRRGLFLANNGPCHVHRSMARKTKAEQSEARRDQKRSWFSGSVAADSNRQLASYRASQDQPPLHRAGFPGLDADG